MKSELYTIPSYDWNKIINRLDLNLSFKLHIELMKKFHLQSDSDHRLRSSSIGVLDNKYTLLRAGGWADPPFILSARDAPAGFSTTGYDRLAVGLSGIRLDATELVGHAEDGPIRTASRPGSAQ